MVATRIENVFFFSFFPVFTNCLSIHQEGEIRALASARSKNTQVQSSLRRVREVLNISYFFMSDSHIFKL